MSSMTRRSLLRRSVSLLAGASLARPYIANAAAKTAVVWWAQGFAQQEDIGFRQIVEGYQKASGNVIDYSIIPYAPLRQKIVSALTSEEVPDVFQNTPVEALALEAWKDQLVDLTDVVETQRSQYTDAALKFAYTYNGVEKRRAYYGAPYSLAGLVNHVWRPLVEKAGFKMDDVPKTWDNYYDFFKGLQKPLRAQGMRNVFGLGFTLSTTGNDSNNQFNYFLIANGGSDIVTKDGKLHLDDPKVREGVFRSIAYTTNAYKDGFIPSSATSWNDSDNNNAFHAKQIVMDIDGTISTEVAIIDNKQDYDDIVTMGLPLDNNSQPISNQVTANCGVIPKGAKNLEVAKDFLKYLIQPKVAGEYLKIGLGRNLPAMTSIVEDDPWWTADPHRKTYVEHCLLGPIEAEWFVYNPAYAEVRNQHVWGTAWADIIQNGMTPQEAGEKAFKWVEAIFAKYPIEWA
ncbi:MAG TPA: ABC transporter substrate-binding protein [Stellaceae bacterium]|jgi:multiple sugar transport system substrate-binding protein|nr:ABC transporter substrate-binding protein [Stellaceae bacterium]